MKLPTAITLITCLIFSFSAGAQTAAEKNKAASSKGAKSESAPKKNAPAAKKDPKSEKAPAKEAKKKSPAKPKGSPKRAPADQAKTAPPTADNEASRRETEAQERLKKLLGDVVKLTGGVDVEHLSAEKAHVMARELLEIQKEAEIEIEILATDEDDEEVHRVTAEIQRTLGELKKRIGNPGAPVAGLRLLGHPIPQFENKPSAATKATVLRKAQHDFVDAINDPELKRSALVELIVAEEELAWEAGWPFTAGELKAVESDEGRISRKIYLSRLKRGVGAVQAKLREEHDANGRSIRGRPFQLHVPVDEKLAELANLRIKSIRGHDFAWVEISAPFDAEAEASLLNPDIKRR